jgi:hypothetical protein
VAESQEVAEQHPLSRRWAVFEDDGVSAWLYLTQPDALRPVADCWLYNRITPPSPGEIHRYRGRPPPASTEYAGPESVRSLPEAATISFKWSADGESVAVSIGEEPLGLIVQGQPRGLSKNLRAPGPWGQPWDEALYQSVVP